MDSRRFSGPKSVTIYVSISSPQPEEISLQVLANGREELSMSPNTIAFDTVRKGNEAKGSLQITLLGDPNWNITEIQADSNFVKPEAKLVKRNGAEVTFEISGTLRSDLPVGKWYTHINLTTNNLNVAKVHVPLTVEVGAPVTATPELLTLGDIKIGDSVEQKVTLKGAKPFKIKSVLGTDALVTVSDPSKDSKAMHILTVTIKPKQAGVIARDLSIQTEGEDATTLNVPIKAMGVKE